MKLLSCATLVVMTAMLVAKTDASGECGYGHCDSNVIAVGNFVPAPKRQGFYNAAHVDKVRDNASSDQVSQPMPPKVPTVEELARRCPPPAMPDIDGIQPPSDCVRITHPAVDMRTNPSMLPKNFDIETSVQATPPIATPTAPPTTAFEQLFQTRRLVR